MRDDCIKKSQFFSQRKCVKSIDPVKKKKHGRRKQRNIKTVSGQIELAQWVRLDQFYFDLYKKLTDIVEQLACT